MLENNIKIVETVGSLLSIFDKNVDKSPIRRRTSIMDKSRQM
ncbi:MAG: hypothetical protein ACLVKR_08660 [Lachnospiraceae bacterium]